MISSKSDYKFYLQQDRKALNIPERRAVSTIVKEIFYPNPIWKFEKRLKRLEYLTNCTSKGIFGNLQWLWAKICYRRISLKLGFTIFENCFGPGLSIAHYGTIVVNHNARTGKNCRLHACVNIGASTGKHEAPQLGDNVYIGPGAILFGNIRIADNVTIGANATVNKDCLEEGVVLAGTPATIIKRNFPVWWINNQLDMSE
jgi:serine O-acetyltransferase